MTLGALLVAELEAGAYTYLLYFFFLLLLLYCSLSLLQANPVSGGAHGGSLHPA
jgi:hypothetical protein